MAKWQNFNWIKYAIIGAMSGLITLVISFIFKKIPIPVYSQSFGGFTFTASGINLREQITNSSFFAPLGQKFVDLLSFLQIDGKMVLTILIGSILTIYAGRIVVGWFNAKPNLRIFLSYILGYTILGLVVAFSGIDFITAVLSAFTMGLLFGLIMQAILQMKSLRYLIE